MWFKRMMPGLFGRNYTPPPVIMNPRVPQTQPQGQQTGGGLEWFFSHSPNLLRPNVDVNGRVWFDLSGGGEPHMLLKRRLEPLTGRVLFKWQFSGGSLRSVGGGDKAHVSIIVTSVGNTFGGDAAQASKRWYWWGPEIVTAGVHEVPFHIDYWHNRDGKKDAAAFVQAMATPTSIGLAFGNPGAGATAHGITGHGTFEFTLEITD